MSENVLTDRNLDLLRRHYPAYADVLSAVHSTATAYSLETSDTTVLCRDANGRWIHGPDDPRAAAQREAELVVERESGIYIVMRPGLGYQALAVVEAVEARSPNSVVLVVEDRLDLFKVALGLVDWAPVLRFAFTLLLLGDPEVVLEAFFRQHPRLALLPVTLVASPDFAETSECERIVGRLAQRTQEVRPSAEAELDSASRTLRERRSRREPPRVLLAGDYGYLSEPIVRGFRSVGCVVECIPGDPTLRRAVRAHEWLWQVTAFSPDLMVWLNRPELSAFASDTLRGLKVATALWSVDSPRRMRLTRDDLRAVDVHAYFDDRELAEYGSYGARRSVQLSIAAGIDPLPGCGKGDEHWPRRVGPPVGFVGSLGEARVAPLRETIRSRSAEDLRFSDELAAAPGDPGPILERETGGRYDGIPCLYIDEVRSMDRRINVLSRLAPAGLQIFGGSDWGSSASRLADCYARRPIRYGSDLASVYYHSQINVNVFHAQCVDSTNSRVYDVLAAGGFLLTEDRPVLHREFEVGRHLVTFSTPEEASEKAAYYLAHPAEREEIARAGQRHVLARHTFANRCQRLMDLALPFMSREMASAALEASR